MTDNAISKEIVDDAMITSYFYGKRDVLITLKEKITKLIEKGYLEDHFDEWAQGEHYAYQKVISMIDEYMG